MKTHGFGGQNLLQTPRGSYSPGHLEWPLTPVGTFVENRLFHLLVTRLPAVMWRL